MSQSHPNIYEAVKQEAAQKRYQADLLYMGMLADDTLPRGWKDLQSKNVNSLFKALAIK